MEKPNRLDYIREMEERFIADNAVYDQWVLDQEQNKVDEATVKSLERMLERERNRDSEVSLADEEVSLADKIDAVNAEAEAKIKELNSKPGDNVAAINKIIADTKARVEELKSVKTGEFSDKEEDNVHETLSFGSMSK